MRPSKRGPSLFEVMNKAPLTQGTRRKISIFGQRKTEQSRVLPVAEALTEEQAAAEFSAQRAQLEAERYAREEKAREKEATRAAKQAAKEARREAKLAARQSADENSGDRHSTGRFSFSLTTSSCIAAVGVLSAIVLGAYALGHRSARDGDRLSPVAATSNPDSPISGVGSPLLPANKPITQKPPVQTVEQPKPKPTTPVDAARDNPDLAHLLQRPQTAEAGVGANQPVRVSGSETAQALARPENLNYLQIESFLVTRDRSGDQLARDVAETRDFLLKQGIRTFARKRSNGYVLFAEEGLPPGKEHRPQRDALIRKIQSLGAEYRKLGGQYQFKGCLFVSYATTQAGDPVY